MVLFSAASQDGGHSVELHMRSDCFEVRHKSSDNMQTKRFNNTDDARAYARTLLNELPVLYIKKGSLERRK